MGTVEVSGTTYHINDNLIKKWDKLKNGHLKKIDEDRCYVTDGKERSGKSVFTIQQIAYIDPTIIEDEENGKILPRLDNLLNEAKKKGKTWEDDTAWRREAVDRFKKGQLLPRITFNATSTLSAIRKNRSSDKETKAILFDEAFRGMSSKGSLSKENKELVRVLMEMGQSNLVLWIVLPSFFLLELYPAMLRSSALFHVAKDKDGLKRIVRIFNFKKKAQLYQIGLRKGWGYPLKTKERVNFYNKYPAGDDFEWRYRLKKQLSLREESIDKKEEETKYKNDRDLLISFLKDKLKLSSRKMSEFLDKIGIKMSHVQINNIDSNLKKKKDSKIKAEEEYIGDKDEETIEIDEKFDELLENSDEIDEFNPKK